MQKKKVHQTKKEELKKQNILEELNWILNIVLMCACLSDLNECG